MRYIFFIVFLLSITFFSCSSQYGVANQSSFTKFLDKPLYNDSTEVATYIAAQYYNNDGNGFQPNEKSYFMDFSIHRSHTIKNFNISYGILGYFGNYETKLTGFEDKHSFYGYGALADFNYKLSLRNFELRIIGLRASFVHEMGEFTNFREEMSDAGLIINRSEKNTPVYLALQTNHIYKINSDFSVGLYSALGRTFDKGSDSSEGSLIYTIVLHGSYKKITTLGQINFGLGSNLTIYSFGLQYNLF